MKKIISLITIAIIILAANGCQEKDEEINVSLKSSGILTIYDNWKSGNAAFECKSAGGDCGYAFKIDDWDEEFGMDGVLESSEGNSIKILNSRGKTFDWISEYPVCKVIVKAGLGAYVYNYPEGAYHDEGLLGFKGKGISHVTFCYGEPSLIITAKVWFHGQTDSWAVTVGKELFTNLGSWCDGAPMGINAYPETTSIPIKEYQGDIVGELNIIDGKIIINLNEGLELLHAHIFIGTKEELQDPANLLSDGCPNYYVAPWFPYVTPTE